MSRIRVLIADDHEQICQLVVEVLALDAALEVVATVTSGRDAVGAALEHRPDVVILDRSMPGVCGIQACELLRSESPAPRVVFLSAHDHPSFVAEAFAAGAIGYVLKSRLVGDICPAIHRAMANEPFLSQGISVG